MQVEVIIEVSQGSRNKYEMDHATGRIWLDRMLFTSTRYPADYDFVPGTLAGDGDPLDAMVLLGEPAFCLRALGDCVNGLTEPLQRRRDRGVCNAAVQRQAWQVSG